VPHYQLRFRKVGDVRFLSHLDLMEQWKRAFRRADLPLAFSAGFNPQPKLSLLAPLPVGTESECEVLFAELQKALPADEVRARLQETLPHGLEILSAKAIYSRPAATDLEFTYRVTLPAESLPSRERIEEFVRSGGAVIERQRKGETRRIDVAPFVREIAIEDGALRMRILSQNGKTVRPEEVLEAMGVMRPGERVALRIVRLTTERAEPGGGARTEGPQT
jgi:radical SAM-linked protein